MNKLTKLIPSDIIASDRFVRAITHRSVGGYHNERMEFLGDSVLGLIISTELYMRLPRADEGYLSRLRASLVNKNTLAEIAKELSLGDFMRLGPGELKSGGYRRKSILADALEAVIACIYLEGGMSVTEQFIHDIYGKRLDNLPSQDELKDPKSRLQEVLQSRSYAIPEYTLLDVSGEAHRQTFTAQCEVEGLKITTTGSGRSRRKAEQSAAKIALKQVLEQL